MNNFIKSSVIVFFVLLSAHIALACGPFFDDAYLLRASKNDYLAMPEGNFDVEIRRIFKIEGIDTVSSDKITQEENVQAEEHPPTVSADIGDLKKCFIQYNISPALQDEALKAYESARDKITYFITALYPPNNYIWYGGRFRSHESNKQSTWLDLGVDPFPPGIPEEFRLYMEGAVFYHNYDYESALDKWKELLALPNQKRMFKSVWAAYMIGKAYLNIHNNIQSVEYFELTRKLAEEGFEDSLALKNDSIGWQALAEYEFGDYVSSLKNYARMVDLPSLNKVTKKLFTQNTAAMQEVVKDPMARDIVIAWIVSRPDNWDRYYYDDSNEDYNKYEALLNLIEKTGPKKAIENADRVAWIYYNLGKYDLAKRWLAYAKNKSALARWIDAKINLREGDVSTAFKELRELIPYFEKADDSLTFCFENAYENCQYLGKDYLLKKVNSELGVLLLRRQDYIQALEYFVKGQYWEDSAYLAENVLTTDELKEFITSHGPSYPWPKFWYFKMSHGDSDVSYYDALRYLLGRRLARSGQWERSFEYLPESLDVTWRKRKPSDQGYLIHTYETEVINPRERAKELYGYFKRAEIKTSSPKDRAKNFYEAGMLMRYLGMEIVGTELEPDWFVDDGQFSHDGPIAHRTGDLPEEAQAQYKEWASWYKEIMDKYTQKKKLFEEGNDFYLASKDEKARAVQSLPEIRKRFHYRNKAADLMWKAAALLPDDDNLKAEALWQGGLFLRDRDNHLADKFYKELVKTCGKTALGKEADRIRWFPKEEWYASVKGK